MVLLCCCHFAAVTLLHPPWLRLSCKLGADSMRRRMCDWQHARCSHMAASLSNVFDCCPVHPALQDQAVAPGQGGIVPRDEVPPTAAPAAKNLPSGKQPPARLCVVDPLTGRDVAGGAHRIGQVCACNWALGWAGPAAGCWGWGPSRAVPPRLELRCAHCSGCPCRARSLRLLQPAACLPRRHPAPPRFPPLPPNRRSAPASRTRPPSWSCS